MYRTQRAAVALSIVSALGASAVTPAHASQWLLNGAPVCTAQNNQQYSDVTSDGQGGAIAVWMDARSGQDYDIWAQRFDGWGRPVWALNGVALCTAVDDQFYPRIIGDGAGGAIVVWEDLRTSSDYDIYARRVDANGNVLWTANGVAVCTATLNQQSPQLVSDGAGGAIITWHDARLNPDWNIYAQRISAAGSALWTANGAAVCTQTSNQFKPKITEDGAGGAFVVWEDFRTGAQYDLYVQRLDLDGNFYWNLNGLPLCNAAQNQVDAQIVSDGVGGMIATWEDYRAGAPNTFAQRVIGTGTAQWTLNGVELATVNGGEYDPQIASDGANGAIVAWYDTRAVNGDIYAQRINISGTPLWAAAGAALCTAANYQDEPRIVGDGLGGAIVSWSDQRFETARDAYARRIDASGVPQGTANGVAMCVLPGFQLGPRIASDGAGGGIVVWEDGRTGGRHIYAQRLERFDNWGNASPDIVGARDVPGDQGGKVNVSFDASRFDPWPYQTIDRYTVWRAVDPTLAASFIASGTTLVHPGDPIDPDLTEAIRVEIETSQTYYWQLMATVDAYYLNGYAQEVATQFDSTATTPEPHHFQVIAHGNNPVQYWISAPANGRSLDNIAPFSPLLLTAQRVGVDVLLQWNSPVVHSPDFQHYAIYRASSSGVQPLPGSFVTSALDTVITDSSPPPGYLYYIVTAVDVHSNQSAPSNEASVTIPTGVGDDAPRLTNLTLDSNYPNPFGGMTTLRVGLPRPGDIVFDVYDVAGRRVGGGKTRGGSAGWHSIPFDGRDASGRALPSGVYFYRVTAAGETQTRKMVIRR